MRRASFGPGSIAGPTALLACALACSPTADAPRAAASASPSPGGASDLSRPLPSPVPDVVARVNGRAIRLAQVLPAARSELRRPSVADAEHRKAEALRRALQQCVERELLVQEALARGIEAEARQVDWAYDQLRREYRDDAAWEAFLAGEGFDALSFRGELRLQQTVSALLDREAQARNVTRDEARALLVEKLRAAARIELFL